MSEQMSEYQTATVVEGTNGQATPPPLVLGPTRRVMPVGTRRVDLEGKYVGWWFEVDDTAPFGLLTRLMGLQANANSNAAEALKAFASLRELLPGVLHSWNFVDRSGEPLPCDENGVDKLPMDLVGLIFAALTNGGAVDPKSGVASATS